MYPESPHEEDIDESHYRVKQLTDMGFPQKQAEKQVKTFLEVWRNSATPTKRQITNPKTTPNEPIQGENITEPRSDYINEQPQIKQTHRLER